MRSIFIDTSYWIAVVSPRDELHNKAIAVAGELGPCILIKSDMVLAEVLNMFAERGAYLREAAVAVVQAISGDPSIDVIPQTRRLFQDALAVYRQRSDKSWSLTDCASFAIMDERGIVDALTYDHHFVQKGYTALLRENT
jgi:uncharacterized protein